MPGPGEMKKPQPAPRPPEVPTATTLFKLTNPELMLDPRRRRSWLITGGVAAFFAVYLSWTFYWEAREAAAAQQRGLQSAPPAAGAPPIGDVVKVPPPNRLAHCRQRPGASNRPYSASVLRRHEWPRQPNGNPRPHRARRCCQTAGFC